MADVNWFLEQDDDPNVEVVMVANQDQPSHISCFSELSILDPYLLRGLHESLSLKRPDLMQSLYLESTLKPPYTSLVAQARQSLRKIRCYVISMLARVVPKDNGPQVLCVIPNMTRAREVLEVVNQMGMFTNIQKVMVPLEYDGPNIRSHIVIGSDLALRSVIEDRKLRTKHLKLIVFDDTVDTVSSATIMKDVESKNNFQVQVLIFEGSLYDKVSKRCLNILGGRRFNLLFSNPEEKAILLSQHFKIELPQTAQKHIYLLKLLASRSPEQQAIIFASAENVREIHDSLQSSHGDQVATPELEGDPATADRIFFTFKKPKSKLKILISSATRLDLRYDQSTVSIVINVDIPTMNGADGEPCIDYEAYYRRTSCAGRNTHGGIVFNLLQTPEENEQLKTIEDNYFKRVIKQMEWNDKNGVKKAYLRAYERLNGPLMVYSRRVKRDIEIIGN